MRPFFPEQTDSLFFASGVVLITLSVIILTLVKRRLKLEWTWLAAFGALLSLSRFLTLAGQVLEGESQFITFGVVAQILAFLALLQFACSGISFARGLFAVGIVVPQAAAVLVGVLQRFPGPDAVSLGTLELVAGLWAGIRIYNATSQAAPVIRQRLRMAAVLLGCCGLLWGIPTLFNGNLYFTLQSPNPLEIWTQRAEPVLIGAFLLFLTLALGTETPVDALHKQRSVRYGLLLWSLPVMAAFVLGSMRLISLAGEYGDHSQKELLLFRGRTASAAVPSDWVKDLGGSPADLAKPSYSNLVVQLRRIRSTDPDTRFVYLMGRRAEQVVFLAESEPATSPDHSPPGQVYSEAPATLHRLFENGEPFIEGPLYDRWGVWESAFAPVYGPDRKTVIAVLGMDIDVRLARRIVALHRFAGIGLSLILNLLVLALFTGLHVSRKTARAAAASESRFRIMFENAPEAVFVFEAENGRILAANPFMASWLGFTQGELYALSVQNLMAGSLERIRSLILHGNGDSTPEEQTLRHKDGFSMPAEMTGDSIRFQEVDALVVFARDVTERRLAESELRKRGALLNGVAEAARLLLTNEDYASGIAQALAAMGRAAGVDAVYVFENQAIPETGEPGALRRFSWRDESLPAGITVFSDLQTVSYTRFLRWLSGFSAGLTISGTVRQFPEAERELLERYGVRSLVTAPLMIDGRLWGFIGFDDCKTERQWSEAEVSIVNAAASSIGGAIKRHDAEERIQKIMSELERFNRLMVGRETRVVELKREVNALLLELGRPAAYASVESVAAPPKSGTA
jgi:PAS domain S-box-containing protein